MSESIDWDRIEQEQKCRRSVTYTTRMCPLCSRTISESAYSGRDGNWKKHARACEENHRERK